ncbi:MAG: Hpt domain-containing protein [Deltaproteobacteria bacterium]|jgi:chemotaxis protein histidine kinase CheA|nr:Hpt domain-containing protein [Deltaproteobacteria bacterium]
MASELMDEFIFDAREHLATAGTQLMELENEPDSLAKLNALMGTLHTIKGNSGFVNLKNLYGMLHGAENLLQTVRDTPGHVCPETTVNQLFQVLDAVEVILTRLEAGDDEEVDWLPALNQAIAEEEAALERPSLSEERGPQESPAVSGQTFEAPDEAEIMEPVFPWPEADTEAGQVAAEEAGQDQEGPDGAVIEVLADGQLGEKGQTYMKFLEKGKNYFILDVNSLTTLSFDEIRLIRELVFVDDIHFILIIDPEKQPDFWRLLVLWSLENKMTTYEDLAKAKAALNI